MKSNQAASVSNKILFALFPGLKAILDSLQSQVDQLVQTQTDLQNALTAGEAVVNQVVAEVQALQAEAPDLTPQILAYNNQIAQLQALLPATPAPTA
jgi:peptidoglycan hydrolase CwlO-like protein